MLKLKYPLRLLEEMYPAGTEVRLAPLVDVQKHFPNIKWNAESKFCAVYVADRESFTILLKKQVAT